MLWFNRIAIANCTKVCFNERDDHIDFMMQLNKHSCGVLQCCNMNSNRSNLMASTQMSNILCFFLSISSSITQHKNMPMNVWNEFYFLFIGSKTRKTCTAYYC
eukprot:342146_1